MKCEVTSHTTHDVLISKEVSWKSYKEICRWEPKKVNLGYIDVMKDILWVENNTLLEKEKDFDELIYGLYPHLASHFEILSKFFSIHNIEPNWLDCNSTWGWFDEDMGGWTGCVGKV